MIDIFKDIFALSFFSIILRITFDLAGQKWIRTKSHTFTIVFLPIITYVITSVISGNLALSLGMVGALSIIRFRNPVRSPLELTIYFMAITMGIAASVSLKWSFLLVVVICGLTVFLYSLNCFAKKFNKNLFVSSFAEGNLLSTLEIKLSQPDNELDENKLLKSKIFTQNDVTYLLASYDFTILKRLSKNIQNKSFLISFELNQ